MADGACLLSPTREDAKSSADRLAAPKGLWSVPPWRDYRFAVRERSSRVLMPSARVQGRGVNLTV